MVSRNSIKTGFANLKTFVRTNPNAGFKQSGNALVKFAKETTEAKISMSTLPSLILPTPESVVKKLEKRR